MSQASQFSLLKQRRFAPFFWTQFLGAFNDNVFKTALLVILTYDAVSWTSLDPAVLNSLIPGLFILPYVLFSATAGQIAEKVEKGRLARFVKMLEIGIMLVAGIGWMTHTLWLLIASVVGMGVHSTLFGPVKYAYMPQHLKSEELVGGNGVVEMGTFVGILLGQILGAALVLKSNGLLLVAGATMFFAVLGLVASYRIPLSPAPAPELKINPNPFAESVRNIGHARKNRTVFLSMLGNSWFWFYGAMILSQFPLYAKEYLHGDYSVFVMLLTVFSVGVGVGSLLCEKLSGHKVEIGLVPFGSIGLSLFGIDLYFASIGYVRPPVEVEMMGMLAQAGVTRVLFDIAMIGVFGGLFIVPLFALIQTRCEPAHLSRTIGGMNIMNALFMIGAAGVAIVMIKMGFSIPEMFLATAILNAIVALYIFSLVPEFLMRFLAWMLIHTIHRVKTVDVDRIPEEGPAVLVCNHVSYVDAIVIGAASPRPIRFVMDHKIFKMPFMGWLFRTARAIPIAPAKEDQFLMEKAYIDIAQALHEGDLVCIFPEGRLTSTGEMGEFRGGIAKIVERSKVPVIPMALRGLWGSLLTRDPGNLFERTFARGPRSRLALAVGMPVAPEDATPDYLHKQVLALRGDWK
ncbi:MFS transporter [Massilia pseudoviolaceinigra]|uniref:MFS transporter n=1 Tax=Massilia pseudoviolaceinigra TaxID=3057165 RepID=UPI0027969459|nr:MFS transporter [Massilia sp. CCM 9206]MDQ1924310.1 MFS transporter [Massilia sp. CCM 9206]